MSTAYKTQLLHNSYNYNHNDNYLDQTFEITLLFMREGSYCFQRFLAIAILSVHLSVCPSVYHTGGATLGGRSFRPSGNGCRNKHFK